MQETYLKAFRAADRFEPGTNLRAWLFTILHNTARNRVRDRARETRRPSTARRSSARPTRRRHRRRGGADTPETLLLRETLAPELQAAIDALPEAFRAGGLVTRRGRVFVCRNRRDARRFRSAPSCRASRAAAACCSTGCSHLKACQCLDVRPVQSIDPLVTPYVDGELPRRRARGRRPAPARAARRADARVAAEQCRPRR